MKFFRESVLKTAVQTFAFSSLAIVAMTSTVMPSVKTKSKIKRVSTNLPTKKSVQIANQTSSDNQKAPVELRNFSNSQYSETENDNARSFNATAYCLQGRTATGSMVKRGIVAADPRVLPLGTRIHVRSGNYTGQYTVADTGGGVRGRKLDVWVPSCGEAKTFGRKTVYVSIVKPRS